MSEKYVRVQLANGRQKTFPADHPAVTADGVKRLSKPAVDQHGAPLPDKNAAFPPAGESSELSRAQLVDRIQELNASRDADNQIPTSGNKDALVAAIAAAVADTDGGNAGEDE